MSAKTDILSLPEEELVHPGNRACSGCGLSIVYRIGLKALGKDTIPDYHAAEAAAAVLAYVMAVEAAKDSDPDKVRAALGNLTFMSFYGSWKIDETGKQIGHDMVDVQWQDGKRVIVWPPAAKTGELYYPLPTFAEKAAGKKAKK